MMRRLLLLAGLSLASVGVAGDAVPDRAGVVAVMARAADWQLAHPSHWKADEWHNAAFYTGVMALSRVTDEPRFRAAMVAVGEGQHWQLGPRPYHADDHCIGQMYAELYLSGGEPRMIAPMRASFDHILAHPSAATLSFDRTANPGRLERWSWCDALFMAPPAWIRLWRATGDARYLEYAVEQWWQTSDYLYDATEHLYARDSSLFAQREKNGAKIFWSRGNGWVLGGLVRMLQYLPADHPARPRFEQQFRDMAAKVASLQQPDGLWRSSLLDPASYPMQETSGSSFHCYALAWGVNEGLLPRERFLPVVLRTWAALVPLVREDGRLTHVQPVGFTPVTFDEDSTEPFGVGAFLLAGSEVCRLAR